MKKYGFVCAFLLSVAPVSAVMPPKVFEQDLMRAVQKNRFHTFCQDLTVALSRKDDQDVFNYLADLDLESFLLEDLDEYVKTLNNLFSSYRSRMPKIWAIIIAALEKNANDAKALRVQKLLRIAFSRYHHVCHYHPGPESIPPFATLYGITISKVPANFIASVLQGLLTRPALKRVFLSSAPKDIGHETMESLKAFVKDMAFEEVSLNGVYLKRPSLQKDQE